MQTSGALRRGNECACQIIENRIVKGMDRVVYNRSSKPPGAREQVGLAA
jgi:hypothetical protein